MNQFSDFSPAARLYAENATVVELMYKAFSDSIADFLQALATDVQQRVGARALGFRRMVNEDSTYYWLQQKPDAARENLRLYVNHAAPQIVWPGELRFGVGAPRRDVTDEMRNRLPALAEDPQLKPYWEASGNESWQLIKAKVTYPTNKAVEVAGPVIAAFLLRITDLSENS